MGKRFISQKALSDYPELSDNQFIGKILETKGGGLFQVDCPQEMNINLVQLPSKFQKVLWIKRNSFVIIQPDFETKTKINGEIVSVLLPKDVKYLKSKQLWPFNESEESCIPDLKETKNLETDDPEYMDDQEEEEEKDLDDLFINTNRHYVESSDEEEDS